MATKNRDRWRVRWTERGKMRSQTFPLGTPKRVVDDFERKVRLGLISKALVDDCPTLADYSKRFLEIAPSLKPESPRQQSTIVKDLSSLKCHLLPEFGQHRLAEIKPKDILTFQARLYNGGDGLAPQSIRNIISLLSSVMKLAVIEELVEYNPCSSVPRISREWDPPDFWSFSEKDDFLCGASALDFELLQLSAMATDTGPRIGELRGLQGDCLNLREGWVEYRRTYCTKTRRIKGRTKNGVPRRVYLSPELIRLLQNKAGTGSEELVFPLNFDTLQLTRIDRVLEQTKVKRLTPHGWRHTFASHLLMLGRTPKDIQTALGHKKISTTLDTYGHLLEDYKKGLTEGMNKGLRWAINADTKVVPIAFGGR